MCIHRLEQLYESAVASLGGIWAAKPKDIHAQLVAEFPDITVQVGAGGCCTSPAVGN